MNEIAVYEDYYFAAELSPGWLQTRMNTIIRCHRKDLKLNFANHFVEGGFISQVPKYNAGYTDKITVKYISNIVRKRFEGVFICQVQQNEQEFPDNTFIIVGWEAPLFGSARIYTVLVEAERYEVKWDMRHMKEQNKSFRGRFKYTRRISESWSLGNNAKIKLIAELGGNKDYYLMITICRDEPNDEGYLPARIAPKR
jgi:hypothetical protein